MAVYIHSGKWVGKWIEKKASTAFSANSFVSLDDGYIAPGDSTTGAADEPMAGIYEGPAIAVGSTTTARILVQVPIGPAVCRALVTGTLAITSQGMGYDLSDAVTVDAGVNTYKVVTCVKYISATEGLFMISKSLYANVA